MVVSLLRCSYFALLGMSLFAAPRIANAVPSGGCTNDLDCKSGRICVDKACQPAPPSCACDKDCPGDLICQDHKCKIDSATPVPVAVPSAAERPQIPAGDSSSVTALPPKAASAKVANPPEPAATTTGDATMSSTPGRGPAVAGPPVAPTNAVAPPVAVSAPATEAASESTVESAARLERDAKAALEAGRFTEAAAGFEQAFAITDNPALLFNMALCHRKAGNGPRAVELYREYLRRVPDSPKRTAVEARIKELKESAAIPQTPNAGTGVTVAGPPVVPPTVVTPPFALPPPSAGAAVASQTELADATTADTTAGDSSSPEPTARVSLPPAAAPTRRDDGFKRQRRRDSAPADRDVDTIGAQADGPGPGFMSYFGVMADVGAPDGLVFSLAGRIYPWIRLYAGLATNTIALGFRAGATATPLPPMRWLSLSLEWGQFGAGDANGLVRHFTSTTDATADAILDRVSYSFTNVDAGLDFGGSRVSFFIHGGVSFVRLRFESRAKIASAIAGDTSSSGSDFDVSLRNDPQASISIAPTIKLGLIVYGS